MAHTVKVSKILEGPKNAYFQVSLANDMVPGSLELTNQTLIDPTVDLNPVQDSVPTFRIQEIWYSTINADLVLTFDAPLRTPCFALYRNSGNYIDFRSFGGLYDRSSKLDGTGKLQFTTIGFYTSNQVDVIPLPAVVTLIINVRKS